MAKSTGVHAARLLGMVAVLHASAIRDSFDMDSVLAATSEGDYALGDQAFTKWDVELRATKLCGISSCCNDTSVSAVSNYCVKIDPIVLRILFQSLAQEYVGKGSRCAPLDKYTQWKEWYEWNVRKGALGFEELPRNKVASVSGVDSSFCCTGAKVAANTIREDRLAELERQRLPQELPQPRQRKRERQLSPGLERELREESERHWRDLEHQHQMRMLEHDRRQLQGELERLKLLQLTADRDLAYRRHIEAKLHALEDKLQLRPRLELPRLELVKFGDNWEPPPNGEPPSPELREAGERRLAVKEHEKAGKAARRREMEEEKAAKRLQLQQESAADRERKKKKKKKAAEEAERLEEGGSVAGMQKKLERELAELKARENERHKESLRREKEQAEKERRLREERLAEEQRPKTQEELKYEENLRKFEDMFTELKERAKYQRMYQ